MLDPALTRPGRMGRHIWFRTPTKDDRLDILDLYLGKVAHEPDLDTDRRRDELARITNGYSPSMIEQCCSMALTIAHTEGRREFAWRDIVEAMTTVETGTAQNIEYIQEETRAVAIHEAGHAAAGHVFLEKDVLSTRLSIRKRGGSLGHYQSMEKDERFSHFRSRVMGSLIMTLGAMAAEHVFYGENSQGVSGDVASATATAAAMVGMWAMGPDPVHIAGTMEIDDEVQAVLDRLERIGSAIMNRAGSPGMFGDNPLGAVLAQPRQEARRRPDPRTGLRHRLRADGHNRAGLEKIADALVERKELHGDEVGELLDSVAPRASRARPDEPRDLAAGMSEHPPVTQSTDDHAVGAAAAQAGGRRAQPRAARGSLSPRAPLPHRDRGAGRARAWARSSSPSRSAVAGKGSSSQPSAPWSSLVAPGHRHPGRARHRRPRRPLLPAVGGRSAGGDHRGQPGERRTGRRRRSGAGQRDPERRRPADCRWRCGPTPARARSRC